MTAAGGSGPILAIDTSTSVGSVAVGDGDRILAEVSLGVAGKHSTALMPALDAVVRWAGLTPRDLHGVVVGGGPGSFTGLRIGAATAKGMVFVLGVPLWSYSGLLGAAAGCALDRSGPGPPVCALFDARRREVYAACYGFRVTAGGVAVDEVMRPQALALEEVIDRFRGGEVPVFTGEASVLHRTEIERSLGAAVAPPHRVVPRASSLLWLQRVVPELGAVADPAAWEPDYVRPPGAVRIAAARGESG